MSESWRTLLIGIIAVGILFYDWFSNIKERK
jgi:hypothetical protein